MNTIFFVDVSGSVTGPQFAWAKGRVESEFSLGDGVILFSMDAVCIREPGEPFNDCFENAPVFHPQGTTFDRAIALCEKMEKEAGKRFRRSLISDGFHLAPPAGAFDEIITVG